MNLLVLPDHHTKEDQAIWREAIRRGWKTIRFKPTDDPTLLQGYDMVRYYGNVLHKERLEKFLPITFFPISNTLLSDLHISWTGREIKSVPFGEIDSPLKQDTFIKCVGTKWLEARVYKAGENATSQWQGMQDTDLMYVQEPVEFVDEVRCFVVDGKVLTSSYYRRNKVFSPENLPAWNEGTLDTPEQRAAAFCGYLAWSIQTNLPKNIKKGIPNGVVLDFGRMNTHEQFYLIEANEAWASGLYDCDPEKVFDAIIASQENKSL